MNGASSHTKPSRGISIVIPTLQEEKLIVRTLRQFTRGLRERYDIEIIISDGGSTDKTVSLALPFVDCLVQQAAGNVQNISQGRNAGARRATGNLLLFLNADVVIEDPAKFFSTIVRVFANARIVAATCNVNIYPEEATLTDWMFHNFFNGYFWLLNMVGMGMGRGECHVIRREVFEHSAGYKEELAAGEDYELFLRLRRIGRIRFVRSLSVFESPRRFRKYGYLRISILWFANALSVLFLHRSIVDQWKPVR